MNITITATPQCHILHVGEDLMVNSDISELKDRIDSLLEQGVRDFAIRFTRQSYLGTRAIAVLIGCLETIKEQGGALSVIDANEDILDVLNLIDLDKVVHVYPSDDALVKQYAPAARAS